MVVVVSFIQSVIRYYTIQYVNIHRHACEQSSIIIIIILLYILLLYDIYVCVLMDIIDRTWKYGKHSGASP